jgi:predicted nucleic acid-binding protein
LIVYADSSFLVSLYTVDAHSAEARRRMAFKPIVWPTPLNRTEIAQALYRQVFRGRITSSDASLAWKNFEEDCAARVWLLVDLPEQTWETCIGLAQRFGPSLGVRTLDSLHVACALELKAERFWTFDERQAKLAEAAGLDTRA